MATKIDIAGEKVKVTNDADALCNHTQGRWIRIYGECDKCGRFIKLFPKKDSTSEAYQEYTKWSVQELLWKLWHLANETEALAHEGKSEGVIEWAEDTATVADILLNVKRVR